MERSFCIACPAAEAVSPSAFRRLPLLPDGAAPLHLADVIWGERNLTLIVSQIRRHRADLLAGLEGKLCQRLNVAADRDQESPFIGERTASGA